MVKEHGFLKFFIQQFELFSKMAKLLQFKWVEKKMNNTDHTWLVKKDFVKKEVSSRLQARVLPLQGNEGQAIKSKCSLRLEWQKSIRLK
jgi:hypothetical protein